MLYNSEQLLTSVIRPTLDHLGDYPTNFDLFLTAVACVSACDSSGIGPYQISHDIHWLIWDDYLAKNAELASKVRGVASQHHFLEDPDSELATNLSYATAIAAMLIQYQQSQLEHCEQTPEQWIKLWHELCPNLTPSKLKQRFIKLLNEHSASAA